MVMLNYKTIEIYNAIRQVFGAFYTETLRDVVKNRGIDLDAKNNSDIWAALSYMRDVSECPEKYFSRHATEEDWIWRSGKANRHPNNVDDPADVVYNKVQPCLMDEKFAHSYRDFCKLVMNWEYSRTENDYHIKRIAINQQNQILEKMTSMSVYGGKRR